MFSFFITSIFGQQTAYETFPTSINSKYAELGLIYLNENFMYLKNYIETQLPGTKVYDLEGTYLVWVDFRKFGWDCNKMIQILEEDANVALDHGNWFGENGAGFERFNIACPRSILIKAVESVVSAIKKQLVSLD